MPLYTFFPCKPDGTAPSFEAFNLASDEAAALFARSLLFEHPAAASMSVWRDDQQVLTLLRDRETRLPRIDELRARISPRPPPSARARTQIRALRRMAWRARV